MSAGFYLTSGFIYLNMGCEMMFVLANRMNAQNIDMNTVGSRILGDITKMLCKPQFVEKIMRPAAPISIPTLYDLLNKIVNSSSMKLDKSSMEKLFYLILMTFKKQLFLCSSPLELYSLTKIHLEDLTKMQKKNPSAVQCLENSSRIFSEASKDYNFVQYLQIREQILSMLESYKSRIVLFVQVGLQSQNGQMIHIARNAHNRKEIGMTINHPQINFEIPSHSKPKKKLDYGNFQNWKTDLGKDDYDNIRGSSRFVSSKKEESTDNERSITDFLGLNSMKLDTYEVQIDILGGQTSYQEVKPVKSEQKVTEQPLKINKEIQDKIEKQFDGIADGSGDEGEIDLLDMMDN